MLRQLTLKKQQVNKKTKRGKIGFSKKVIERNKKEICLFVFEKTAK